MDLDKLEKLARDVPKDDEMGAVSNLSRFRLAASPDVVLALIEVVREAQKTEDMLANLYGRDWTSRCFGLRKALSKLEGGEGSR